MNNNQIVSEVRNLFYSSKFDDCISRVDSLLNANQDFAIYQNIQLYKGLSLLESSKVKKGHECMKQLLDESKAKKGDKVDIIDLITFTLYQWQQFDRNDYEAEQKNSILLEKLKLFELQNDLKLEINNGVYLFGLGMYKFVDSFRNSKDLECIQLLKQSLELAPDFKQEVMNQIGWMYDYKNYSKEALEQYLYLYELNPKYPGITNNIALIYKGIGKMEEALEFYKKAEETDPSNTIILSNMGQYFLNQENFEEAEKYYKKSFDIHQNDGFSCYNYGQFLNLMNRKDEAMKVLLEGLEKEPNYCKLYLEIFTIELEKGNYQKCKECLSKCIEINPENGFYYSKMGQFLYDIGEYTGGLSFSRRALSLKLNSRVEYYTNTIIGTCLFRLGKYKESLIEFLKLYNNDDEEHSDDNGNICYILDKCKYIFEVDKISLINSQYGMIQMRFGNLVPHISKPNIKRVLQQRFNEFREILSIIVYQSQIQPYITYKSSISHWDLYID